MSSQMDEFEQQLVHFSYLKSKQLNLTKAQVADSLTKIGRLLKKGTG